MRIISRPKAMGKTMVLCAITVIMLTAFLMSTASIAQVLETRAFEDTNIFNVDGTHSHYYIERQNSSLSANITVYHPQNSLSLYVNTTNVKELWIDCESLYADENATVWYSPIPDFRTWIPSKPLYTVYLKTDGNLTNISWYNDGALDPMEVRWEGTVIPYDNNETWISAEVPTTIDGTTYTVEIFYELEAVYVLEGLAMLALVLGVITVFFKWLKSSFSDVGGDDWGKLY